MYFEILWQNCFRLQGQASHLNKTQFLYGCSHHLFQRAKCIGWRTDQLSPVTKDILRVIMTPFGPFYWPRYLSALLNSSKWLWGCDKLQNIAWDNVKQSKFCSKTHLANSITSNLHHANFSKGDNDSTRLTRMANASSRRKRRTTTDGFGRQSASPHVLSHVLHLC